MVEFFNERDTMHQTIDKLKEKLDNMGTYIPETRLKFEKGENLDDAIPKITSQLEDIMSKYFTNID